MSTYKYLIVDDDDMDRLAVSYYLKDYPFLVHGASFSSSEDCINFLSTNKVDILFVDINMPFINGIELQRQVINKVLCTILISSHTEFALDGFDVNAFDFITKPINKERLDICIKRLQSYLEIKYKADLFNHSYNENSIMVKEGHNYINISPNEVIYLEALKDYTKIVSLNKRNATIHGNLGTVLNGEHFNDFIRIHKSYAIHKKYIQEIKSNKVVLVNNIILPVGLSYKKELLSIMI